MTDFTLPCVSDARANIALLPAEIEKSRTAIRTHVPIWAWARRMLGLYTLRLFAINLPDDHPARTALLKFADSRLEAEGITVCTKQEKAR